jgi:arylsulfatase A-like enzyme
MDTLRRRLAVSLLLALACACGGSWPRAGAIAGTGTETDVYLVIVDGLGADVATPANMPRLAAAAHRRRGSWLTAQAVMPTRTNPNHASLLTGVHPDAHGVTGNRYWSGSRDGELADPRLLEVETLFTTSARQSPRLVTAAVFAKAKLRRLFAGVRGGQASADVAWPPDGATDTLDDEASMAGFRALVRAHRPSLGVLAMADVDRAGHGGGPQSATYRAAVARADRLIGDLLDDLARDGRWRRSIVIVTSDHGFEAMRPNGDGLIEARRLAAPGVHIVCDGGVALVHARAGDAARAERALRDTVAGARAEAAVAAIYALSGPRDDAPPPPADWLLEHPRAGALVLVAQPEFTFVSGADDPAHRFRGDHGGPGVRAVPLVVVGGHPALRRAPRALAPSSVDVAPTIARLLGLPPAGRLDGRLIGPASRGRVLDEIIAVD